MSQHTSWLLSSSPWLSDSWSHGPSFNTCLWWLIWTSTLAFWILSHYSALNIYSFFQREDPYQLPEIESLFFFQRDPRHPITRTSLSLCSGTHLPHPVLTFVLDVYIQDHTRLHSCVHEGSWVQHRPILPSSSHLPRSMLLKLPHLCQNQSSSLWETLCLVFDPLLLCMTLKHSLFTSISHFEAKRQDAVGSQTCD